MRTDYPECAVHSGGIQDTATVHSAHSKDAPNVHSTCIRPVCIQERGPFFVVRRGRHRPMWAVTTDGTEGNARAKRRPHARGRALTALGDRGLAHCTREDGGGGGGRWTWSAGVAVEWGRSSWHVTHVARRYCCPLPWRPSGKGMSRRRRCVCVWSGRGRCQVRGNLPSAWVSRRARADSCCYLLAPFITVPPPASRARAHLVGRRPRNPRVVAGGSIRGVDAVVAGQFAAGALDAAHGRECAQRIP